MAEAVSKVSGRIGEAEGAREQFPAAGFQPEQLRLVSRDDEAGAAQGNFVTGNTDNERDRSGSFMDPMGAGDHVHERDFKEVVQRGNYVLMVLPSDGSQENRARTIVEQAGPGGEGEGLNGPIH